MWNAAEGEKTFTGPYGLAIAYGLNAMIDELEYCYAEDEDDHHFGYRAFADLTLEQKAWTLHKVAFGLLDRKTEIIPLSAFLEAAVATIFRQLEDLIAMEIDNARDSKLEPQEVQDWFYLVRRAISTVHEQEERNLPPFLEDDEEPLTPDCEDFEQWELAVECMESAILRDSDYEDDAFSDISPEYEKQTKTMFGISVEYYRAIPDDPKPEEAKRLLKEATQLCERVIRREEKKLNRKKT